MSSIMDPARPTYPMKPIAALSGYANGQLDDRVLAEVCRGLKANSVSARKFRVLHDKAIKAGIPLSSTGINRPLSVQEAGLFARYDRGWIAGRADYNFYQGVWWSLKPGMAQVATPGGSYHGWARSSDLCVQINGQLVSLRQSDLYWLRVNAPPLGLYFEVSSEDWHCTDYAGDEIPQAVIDWERGEPIIIFAPEQGQWALYPLDPKKATLRYVADKHMKSDLVRYLQGVLKLKAGYPILIDGDFGMVTRDFVRQFQKEVMKKKATGQVGLPTWKAIDKLAGS